MPKRKSERKLPNIRMRAAFTILGAVATLFTLAYFVIFLVANSQMNPDIYLRLSGEREGRNPIMPRSKGIYMFAVSSHQDRDIDLQSLELHYDPNVIDITPIDTEDVFQQRISETKEFPFKLVWQGSKQLTYKKHEVYGFRYVITDTVKPVDLLFRTRAQVAAWSWGFPLNFFSTRPIAQSFSIRFRFVDVSHFTPDIQREYESIFLAGQERLSFNGSTTKYLNPLYVRANRDSVPYEIRSVR